jgi:tRNA threonylcarbamoyladenosine modification (KEOPS) complex  Pcc1 subunit
VATKKSEPWTAHLSISHESSTALAASLACEEVSVGRVDDTVLVTLTGSSASDLRARFNSTMRSLRAASEALMSIPRGGEVDD